MDKKAHKNVGIKFSVFLCAFCRILKGRDRVMKKIRNYKIVSFTARYIPLLLLS